MKKLLTLLLFPVIVMGACDFGSEKSTSDEKVETQPLVIYERLDVSNFQEKLSAATNPQLIDVRTPEEFSRGSIENALNMDYYDNNFEQQLGTLDKSKPVFVYCRRGNRSKKTADIMLKMGFSEIYELRPGYSGWEQ